jgi:toxin YoeB
MTYFVELTKEADDELQAHIQAGNKILLKKIFRLFTELEQHPQTGTGKPKLLKYRQSGIWSRRIDDKHRLLYTINNDIVTVFVLSIYGHYGDK